MVNILGHQNMEQMVTEDTWSRIINGNQVSSRIDHIYTNCEPKLQRLLYSNEAYSDHVLITFILNEELPNEMKNPTYMRSWYGYSSTVLQEELSK